MENKKDMAAMAEDLIHEIMRGKMGGAIPLEMTPEKMRAFAMMFPRKMVEESLIKFIGSLVLEFFGTSESELGYVLLDRANSGDETAKKILAGVEVLAGIIACDLKGEEYDWKDDEG